MRKNSKFGERNRKKQKTLSSKNRGKKWRGKERKENENTQQNPKTKKNKG